LFNPIFSVLEILETMQAKLFGGAWLVCAACLAQSVSIPADSPRWELQGKQAKVTEYQGRKCLWLQGGSASLKDFEMEDATLDLDIAGPGVRGFYGISFRADPTGNSEYVYLRPHKTGLDDAQQYTPVFRGAAAWQIYNGPGFTAAVDIPRDAWFHVRLVVSGAQAKLYVGDLNTPSLVIDDLKTGIRKGGIALTGPAYFGNFEIRETPPVAWERHQPAMPAGTIAKWSLSPSFDAVARNLEAPLSNSEQSAMQWEDVAAEPPGFVVINRYRDDPRANPTFANDFSKRLEPQKGMKVVYARTAIVAEKDEIKKLDIGYSDEVSVFLNGRILYRGRSAQRFRDPGFLGIVNPENDALYLDLKKGRNELVLAVSELTGGWGFICRLE
jgi:hypothetical protein